MICNPPTPRFQIGDEVETTPEYSSEIEKWNKLCDMNTPPYQRGQITDIQTVTDYKNNNRWINGLIWKSMDSEIERIWICVTLDNDPEKRVDQMDLRKVGIND